MPLDNALLKRLLNVLGFFISVFAFTALYSVSGVVRQKMWQTPPSHNRRFCVILGTFSSLWFAWRRHITILWQFIYLSLHYIPRITWRGVCLCVSHKEAITSSVLTCYFKDASSTILPNCFTKSSESGFLSFLTVEGDTFHVFILNKEQSRKHASHPDYAEQNDNQGP